MPSREPRATMEPFDEGQPSIQYEAQQKRLFQPSPQSQSGLRNEPVPQMLAPGTSSMARSNDVNPTDARPSPQQIGMKTGRTPLVQGWTADAQGRYHHHHPDRSAEGLHSNLNKVYDDRLRYQPGTTIVRPAMTDVHGVKGQLEHSPEQRMALWEHSSVYDKQQKNPATNEMETDDSDDVWHFDPNSYPRAMTFSERFWMKANKDPIVPIGAGLTVAALSGGLWSFVTGRRQYAQKFMWARVGFQGVTLVALAWSTYRIGEAAKLKRREEEAMRQ